MPAGEDISGMTNAPPAQIMIRPGYADDDLALARLAALDSAPTLPPAPLLLAEIDGQLRVAVSLLDGSAIADPFVPTADVISLVRAYASAPDASRPRRLLRRRGRFDGRRLSRRVLRAA